MRQTVSEEKEQWKDNANCTVAEPDLFFAYESQPDTIKYAKQYCRSCPVQLECLSSALREEAGERRSMTHGIRGGLTRNERYALRKKMEGNRND